MMDEEGLGGVDSRSGGGQTELCDTIDLRSLGRFQGVPVPVKDFPSWYRRMSIDWKREEKFTTLSWI